jgi:hypothetical protein
MFHLETSSKNPNRKEKFRLYRLSCGKCAHLSNYDKLFHFLLFMVSILVQKQDETCTGVWGLR